MKEKIKMSVILGLVGLMFLVVGLYLLFFNHMGYKKTTAKITKIEMRSSEDTYTYVTFAVDGVVYSNINCMSSSSSYSEGKKIKIYYDPNDPTKVQAADTITGGVISLTCAGGLFFTIILIFTKGQVREDEEGN